MAQRIAHRGPDDSGVWVDGALEVALGHRRLSIVELSAAGSQPMTSASKRSVIVFNGEIYNQAELRQRLGERFSRWRGHSDTETLLECLESLGPERTLKAAIGMFAFAWVDRQERCLYLARDRAGEKPLYYGWQGPTFMFASELKALKAHPHFSGEIDRNAIALQLRHNYIPAPYSIYKGIRKLVPGTCLRVPLAPFASDARAHDPETTAKPYWSLRTVQADGQSAPFQGGDCEAVEALDSLLRDSVRRQMVADVPLGAFLSGGIDSSTVVALMQTQSTRPVRTFTIGFGEEGYDEAEHAKAVARHLGTEHLELYVSPAQAMDVIPRLPRLYDEPFSDSSQIPTFLVSQLTRRHVTVSLSGDAGDELFGGYSRYGRIDRIWRRIDRLPAVPRGVLGKGLQAIPPTLWDLAASPFKRLLPLGMQNVGHKARKLGEALAASAPELIYRGLVSHWPRPDEVVLGATEPPTVLSDPQLWSEAAEIQLRMMHLDFLSYLPDDILCKVDRAAMAVSLETRIPFLDHRVIEFAWRLPMHMKVRNGQGKWLLRQVLQKYVPQTLTDRPKMGFGIPLDGWLRGSLRAWVEDLIGESRIRQEGFLNPVPIRRMWREHLTGLRKWPYQLWDVLMLQAWLAEERTA
jgi:asparagine synthase (glutamine-hydrolysing)